VDGHPAAPGRGRAEELDPLTEPEDLPAAGAGETAAEPDGHRPRGDYFVQSLERGLAVIRAFTAEEPELTLSDIARRTGMTRAAARRFVLTLLDLGYVGTIDRRFHLRPSVLELGYTYLSMLSFPQVATSHLTALSAELNETTSVAVLDGDDIVYVARVGARRVWSSQLTVGTRLPAYVTSHGRVLLAAQRDDALEAYLARARLDPRTAQTTTDREELRRAILQARADDFSLVDQELEEGVTSIAVPIRESSGAVVASVNVGTQARRHSPAELQRIALEPLRETARQIERDIAVLGARVAPPAQF
jgi:IclR family pca regulon transcriptional regulator